jgi:hypothetical protein
MGEEKSETHRTFHSGRFRCDIYMHLNNRCIVRTSVK